jgi:hypothetical protein
MQASCAVNSTQKLPAHAVVQDMLEQRAEIRAPLSEVLSLVELEVVDPVDEKQSDLRS